MTSLEQDAYIHDYFLTDNVPPEKMDALWASGWRHFGSRFFRYNIQFDEDTGELQHVQPLRIDLARFTFSKSQRRVMARNRDLRWEVIPARADREVQDMFDRHKTRFATNPPDHLLDYLYAGSVATRPCECLEFRAMLGERLVAASFLSVGAKSTSSIYAVFDLEFSKRSLGTLTLLKEIEYSLERRCEFYYPGYATRESSVYDYKKRFRALQYHVWNSGQWRELAAR